MGLDIVRFVEIRKDNVWKRLKWREKDDNTEEGKSHASHFNNGKSIAEYWLEENNTFHCGLPNDCDKESEEIYHDWGYSPCWITLKELESLHDNYQHSLLYRLKSIKNNDGNKIDQILALLKKEDIKETKTNDDDEYYSEYPWEDYDIKDEFDDVYALSIWKMNMLYADINSVTTILEDVLETYVSGDNVRIIYVYNR